MPSGRYKKPYDQQLAVVARNLGYTDSLAMVHTLERWGWSNERIAEMAGVSSGFLTRWVKRNGGGLSRVQLQAMAHHLSGVKI